jgi:hypothetical protein
MGDQVGGKALDGGVVAALGGNTTRGLGASRSTDRLT